jgi:hypothetical protein
VVTEQGIPVETPQAFVLAGWLLLLLDVAGKMPAKPGMWERNANANTLAPTATTTTPTVMIRIVFVMPPVADLAVELVLWKLR